MSQNQNTSFATSLLQWHSTIDRNLPWKASNDPYRIWLSEIIMQQTRIEQGTPYYLRFVEAFPTIIELADADEDQVMKLWQGLGYYSRARNLHHTAKTIRDEYNGIFPSDYKDILALKGVGRYTAAAISSFAFDQEYPVVDGNVIRAISRYFGITAAVDTSQTLKEINQLAEKLIKGSDPAMYNQAIMDFGALMCAPKSPNCIDCPMNHSCLAFEKSLVDSIPFKSKKVKKKERFLHYFYIVDSEGKTILNHRNEKDIWRSLYDMPCIENDSKNYLTDSVIQDFITGATQTRAIEISVPSKIYKHILSHRTIYGIFYKIKVAKLPKTINNYILTEVSDLETFAFPVLLTNFLEESKEWTLF